MLITKSIGFDMTDPDAVALEIAEEVKKGWHISKLETHGIKIYHYERDVDPAITIHFVRSKPITR